MHVDGSVDSVRDIHTIEDELVIKDLESLEKKEERLTTQAKSGDREIKRELEIVSAIRKFVEEGNNVRNFEVKEEDEKYLKDLFLLTSKPVSLRLQRK